MVFPGDGFQDCFIFTLGEMIHFGSFFFCDGWFNHLVFQSG